MGKGGRENGEKEERKSGKEVKDGNRGTESNKVEVGRILYPVHFHDFHIN